jgi:propanediol dehydratase small subunit
MSESKDKYIYPLMEHAADILQAASGRRLSEITFEAATENNLSATDLQTNAETLHAQAEIARQAGYRQLAENLSRAAELTVVPSEDLLQMYEMLRPGRATFKELVTLAETLENKYNAPGNAHFVREAALVYQTRRLLRRE